jgi:hypothetical protein
VEPDGDNGGSQFDEEVSVFASNGRTGILSMVISWKFAQGPSLLSLNLAAIWATVGWHSDFFLFTFCRDACSRRREKDEERKGKGI